MHLLLTSKNSGGSVVHGIFEAPPSKHNIHIEADVASAMANAKKNKPSSWTWEDVIAFLEAKHYKAVKYVEFGEIH